MDLDTAFDTIRELLGLEETAPIPLTLNQFLEQSKTQPGGFYRPFIAVARFWKIKPPRSGIIKAEQVEWKDTLKDQIAGLAGIQESFDNELPADEIIPENWGVNQTDLPIFSAMLIR